MKEKKKILLVEDEALVAMSEAKQLMKYGYDVVTASNGRDAVEVAQLNRDIDLVLMDIDLGRGMDGTEAAAIILRDRDMPVVFLSSHTEPAVVEKTEKITSYGYVVKNTGITVLDASIKMAFRLFEARARERAHEEALRESLETSADIVQAIPSGLFIYQFEEPDRLILLSGNREAEALTGIVEEEWRGREFNEIWPQAKNKGITQAYLEVMRTGRMFETEDLSYADERIVGAFRNRAFLLPGAKLGVAFENITKRKVAEEALRESETRLRTLSDNLPGGLVYQIDSGTEGEQRRFTYISAGVERLHGVTSEEVLRDAMSIYVQVDEGDRAMVAAKESAALAAMTPFSEEMRVILPSGEVRWRLFASAPRRLQNRHVVWDGVELDVTDRRLAEQALRQSEERYGLALRGTNDGVWDWDLTTDEVVYSKQWKSMLGFGEGDVGSRLSEWERLVHPEDRDRVMEAVRELIDRSSASLRVEMRMQHRDGHWVHVLSRGDVIRDTEGRPVRIVGTHVDITEWKRAEERLIENERRFRALIEHSADAISLLDERGNVLYNSPSYDRIVGYSGEEIIGRNSFNLVHPDERETMRHLFAELLRTRGSVAIPPARILHGDGSWHWVEGVASNLLDEACVHAVIINFRDITERRRAESQREAAQVALRQSDARFRALVENSNDGILFCDAQAVITYRSPSFVHINGHTNEERMGRSVFDTVHPDDLGEVKRFWNGVVGRPGALLRKELRIRHKDGSWIWLETTAQNLLHLPDIRSVVLTSRDITERKKVEEALRVSEERFARAFLAAPDAMIISRQDDGHIIDVNDSWESVFKFPREEVIGRRSNDLGVFVDAEQRNLAIQRLRNEGFLRDFRMDIRTKWGQVRHVSLSIEPLEVHGESCMLTVVRDITDRLRAEEEIARSIQEKTALLHEIQHRVKNNLFMITSLIDLEADSTTSGETRSSMGKLRDRIASLGSLYAILHRTGGIERVRLDEYVGEIVGAVLQTHGTAESGIEMVVQCEPVEVSVQSAAPLGLITNELVTNALKYGFPGRRAGTIDVILKNGSDGIALSVRDDGAGPPADFDPERSRGMGLEMVRMLAAQLGGVMEYSRNAGITAFSVRVKGP